MNEKVSPNLDDQVNNLFEQTLRSLPYKAFEALVSAKIRDVSGLLGLSKVQLDGLGISSEMVRIILEKQNLLREKQNALLYNVQSQNEITERKSDDTSDDSDFLDIINTLPYQTYEILKSKGVSNATQFLALTEDVMRANGFPQHEVVYLLIKQQEISRKHGFGGRKHKKIRRNIEGNHTAASKQITQESSSDVLKTGSTQLQNNMTTESLPEVDPFPATWSILERSISDVLQIVDSKESIEVKPFPTIEFLCISETDKQHLQSNCFYEDDCIDVFIPVTITYLLGTGISEDTLNIISDALTGLDKSLSNLSGAIMESISANSVFQDVQMDKLDVLRLFQFNLDSLKHVSSSVLWGEIKNLSEREVVLCQGITIASIERIKEYWFLRKEAIGILKIFSANLPDESYKSYEILVNSFLSDIVKNDRDKFIVIERLGLIDGKIKTLEEVGQVYNVTRERIRQIEAKLLEKLLTEKQLSKLSWFWLILESLVRDFGGACYVSELIDQVGKHFSWNISPSIEAFSSFISMPKKFELIDGSSLVVMLKEFQCLTCADIKNIIKKRLNVDGVKVLSFQDANELLRQHCVSKTCGMLQQINMFSRGFFFMLTAELTDVFVDDQGIYGQLEWLLKTGKDKVGLVEQFFIKAGRALHFKDVAAELNKELPSDEQLSERQIYSYIDRSPNLLLWDRGTYIYKDFASIPVELVKKVENNIISRLDSSIPYLSISGIYKDFEPDLKLKGDLSESALYTCIRNRNNPKLVFPEYPYIMSSRNVGERQPINLVLENYIANREGITTYQDLLRYVTEDLGVKEVLFVAYYYPNIPNIVRVNRGELIHIDQIDVDKDLLRPLVVYTEQFLEENDNVTAHKLFNDKRITCKQIGIATPYLLYSLLELYFSDKFSFTRFPSIFKKDDSNLVRSGMESEVIKHIFNKQLPCSYSELIREFVDRLGYKPITVYNIRYSDPILRYSEGVVVHVKNLNWTDAKQIKIENAALQYLKERENAGKPFGSISDLYEFYYDLLPELPRSIHWTQSLFGELLCSNGKFRMIGAKQNAFISIPNLNNIYTLSDLLHFIIVNEYDGAENLDRFISDMKEAGILIKSLTPLMLGEGSKLVISGNVIKLKELSKYASAS